LWVFSGGRLTSPEEEDAEDKKDEEGEASNHTTDYGPGRRWRGFDRTGSGRRRRRCCHRTAARRAARTRNNRTHTSWVFLPSERPAVVRQEAVVHGVGNLRRGARREDVGATFGVLSAYAVRGISHFS